MNLNQINEAIQESEFVLLHFTANWCQPCKRMEPIIEEYTSERPNINYIKIDVDEYGDTALSMGVKSVPTFMSYHGGNQLHTKTGAMPMVEFKKMFDGAEEAFYESSGLPETDAMGREKFWEDLGRP